MPPPAPPDDIESIVARYRHNERVFARNQVLADKFHRVETRILTVHTFEALFTELFEALHEIFAIPHLWLVLTTPGEVAGLVNDLADAKALGTRLVLLPKERFAPLVDESAAPRLVNRDLARYRELMPPALDSALGSLAVVPIGLGRGVIGSLNFGDTDRARYTPDMDTTFLERLAVKVSLCLSNVTAHEKLRTLANRDPLTGLLNRRVMESVLAREFTRARRYRHPLTVAFLDLDDFKRVNDTHGHDSGDALLRHVARHLVASTRDSDVVARYAGDEFVVILPQTTAGRARVLLTRLQHDLRAQPLQRGGTPLHASVSIGVASSQDAGLSSAGDLLRAADADLYRAKRRRP